MASTCSNAFNFTKKGFKVAHYNINHLEPKINQLRYLIFNEWNTLDVLGVSETFLNSTYNDSEVNVDGYSILRKDRQHKCGGGLVVYIRNTMKYERLYNLEFDG